MLLLLSTLKERLPSFEIFAVTYDDFKGKEDPTYNYIKDLADFFGINHEIITEKEIMSLFNLKISPKKIFKNLMKTEDADKVMYADHHVMRRTIEAFAEENKIKKIFLGLHASDIIAGFLNSYITGYVSNPAPRRIVGDFEYMLPLCNLTKKELKIYSSVNKLTHISSSEINSWEINPLDCNLYYYLADQLQFFWPNIHSWLIEGHKRLFKNLRKEDYVLCKNCRSPILPQSRDKISLCDVCKLFEKHNYLQSKF